MAYFLTLTASNVEDDRPHILWSMHFTLNDWSELDLTDQAVENVLVCSDGGDAEIDLDKCVPEVKVPKIRCIVFVKSYLLKAISIFFIYHYAAQSVVHYLCHFNSYFCCFVNDQS